MKVLTLCMLLISFKSYSCFDDKMNFYPCDDTNSPLKFTPFFPSHIPLNKAVFGDFDLPTDNDEDEEDNDHYVPHKDHRPTSDYNNEEVLRERDMAELIVIDIKPFTNAPEIQHLIGSEIIVNPYAKEVPKEEEEYCEFEDCE